MIEDGGIGIGGIETSFSLQRSTHARRVSIRGVTQSPTRANDKSPFLLLPLEIRQQIYRHLLPKTVHLRLPKRAHGREIAWQRGNISLLMLNRQIHIEAASELYGGRNVFVLEVDYDGIRFQLQRLTSSGLIPNEKPRFLDKIARPNVRFLKNVIVNVNHVDSYTGMIKYNCGGLGLTNGIRLQVKKLVDVLKTAERLAHVEVHLTDHKLDIKTSQQSLEPFAELDNIYNKIVVTGADSPDFLEKLRRTRRQSGSMDHTSCSEGRTAKATRLIPDLALANFYEDIHATPRELQGF